MYHAPVNNPIALVMPQVPSSNSNHMDFKQHQEDLGFDEIYEEYKEVDCTPITIPISTVHVKLDCSTQGRLLVLVSFKDSKGTLFPATVLVDTGAMANFVNKGFV
jgi:hypothetical protein